MAVPQGDVRFMVKSSAGCVVRRDRLMEWQAAAPVILPSLLLCDFGNLQREVQRLEAARVGGLHLDVMDGHFVPNLTYGLPIVKALRSLTQLPLDVHLMISNPADYVERFFEAGADGITFHAEAVSDARPLLARIRRLGAWAGVALNPATPISMLEDCLDLCDLVLVMSVQPGFGGQTFMPVALEKLSMLRELVGRSTFLQVDGGVGEKTVASCVTAGAQGLVVGSAIFGSSDYAQAVDSLRQRARSV
jgi:ribulose-phosphate 3-epimerase